MRRVSLLALAILVAGGAGAYALRPSGGSACPRREELRHPLTSFRQEPRYYVTVTLTNPNACYGFRDEPMEITIFGPHGWRAISYFGEGPAHGDVGVCCSVTLPPHGSWSMRFGAPDHNQAGSLDYTICNIHVETVKRDGLALWTRMPDGGAITGHGYFPSSLKWYPPLPDDPAWRAPCDPPLT